jgi:alginate O-acetyltransferase complex protein AlgI
VLFNSFNFIFLFLPIVLFIAKTLKGQKLLAWITISSFVFYAFAGHVWFIVPMLFTTVLDYKMGQFIETAKTVSSKKTYLIISLFGNLGLLAYFKYLRLIMHTLENFFPGIAVQSNSPWFAIFYVTLPAGISFYTFQTLSYIIDVYRGECEAERNFFRFAGFVSFFPHLVAGPLTRHNQLIPALKNIADKGIKSNWSGGLFLFSLGMCKKILIADRVGDLIDPLLTNIPSMGFITSWATLLGYAIQIYFDFSGYSDMAIGLGRLFGIELPENFRRPYKALNPSDFWTKWHITLSRWLRDYLYISLGGNRLGEPRRNFNLMMTMFLGGLWHGASWTFAIWGIYHGLLLVLYHQAQKYWDSWSLIFKRSLTFFLVCLGWVFFRALTFTDAMSCFNGLLGFRGIGAFTVTEGLIFAFVFLALHVEYLIPVETQKADFGINNGALWAKVGLGVATAFTLLLMNYSSKFLYFQF